MEKRSLEKFWTFLVESLIFWAKNYLDTFVIFFLEHEVFIKILLKATHSIEKIVLYMIMLFKITNIKSDP